MAEIKKMVCPYNKMNGCTDEQKPIIIQYGGYKCKNGLCLYLEQLSGMNGVYLSIQGVSRRLDKSNKYLESIDASLGVKEGETTIHGQLDEIKKCLGSIEGYLKSIDESLGVTAGDNTIATWLEYIEERADWIRQNVGATEEGEGTIYGALNDLHDMLSAINDNLPGSPDYSSIEGKLDEIIDQLERGLNVFPDRW